MYKLINHTNSLQTSYNSSKLTLKHFSVDTSIHSTSLSFDKLRTSGRRILRVSGNKITFIQKGYTMKMIATLLVTGFLLYISPIKPMDRKNPTDSKGYQVVTSKSGRSRSARPTKAQQEEKTEIPPKGTSIPEVDKLIQLTLAMQKRTATLLEHQKSTNAQLRELAKANAAQNVLLQAQQEQLRVQGEQMAMLVALVQKFNTNLLPANLLDDSASEQSSPTATATVSNPTIHSTLVTTAQSFVPLRIRDGSCIPDWEDTWTGPNHPHISATRLADNPWESPNHPRK